MKSESTKIRNFTDLYAWKEGHKLALAIYKITRKFPKEEQFGLVAQLRRAAVSLTSNIAEGFGRRSYKDKAQFYSISLGSLYEIENQLLISKDINYVTQDDFSLLHPQLLTVNKILNGLIKSSRETFLTPAS